MPTYPFNGMYSMEPVSKYIDDLRYKSIQTFSSTKLAICRATLTGTDLRAENLPGGGWRLLGGTITGIFGGGFPYEPFSIDGFSIPVSQFNNAIAVVDGGSDPDAISKLFWGLDWIFAGSEKVDHVNFSRFTGSNTVSLSGGDDSVAAGRGADTVYGGDGYDQIQGGDGNDVLYSGLGGANLWRCHS